MIRFLLLLLIAIAPLVECRAEGDPPISIAIEGVMVDKKDAVALIDGHIFAVGDMVQGAKIIEITNTHVKVEYEGEAYSLPVGIGTIAPYPEEEPGIKDKIVNWMQSFGKKPEQAQQKPVVKKTGIEIEKVKTVEVPAPPAVPAVTPAITPSSEVQSPAADKAMPASVDERTKADEAAAQAQSRKERIREEKVQAELARQAKIEERKAAREQAAREKAEREQAERERIAKEKAEREQAERERQAKLEAE
ncbi:MAG TPA: hypothetical protein PK107_06305, partial [Candidatus Omnitrophota bacterium]|nr:hypothetical protein [Candidatus Omnitrophota bacterium]